MDTLENVLIATLRKNACEHFEITVRNRPGAGRGVDIRLKKLIGGEIIVPAGVGFWFRSAMVRPLITALAVAEKRLIDEGILDVENGGGA